MMLLDVSTKSWQTCKVILNQLPRSSHLVNSQQECTLAWALVNTIRCRWVQVLIHSPQPWEVATRILTTTDPIIRQALPIIIHLVRVLLLSLGSVTCMSLALMCNSTCRKSHAMTMFKSSKIYLQLVYKKSRHHQRPRLVSI